jgi:hypothetical protein
MLLGVPHCLAAHLCTFETRTYLHSSYAGFAVMLLEHFALLEARTWTQKLHVHSSRKQWTLLRVTTRVGRVFCQLKQLECVWWMLGVCFSWICGFSLSQVSCFWTVTLAVCYSSPDFSIFSHLSHVEHEWVYSLWKLRLKQVVNTFW